VIRRATPRDLRKMYKLEKICFPRPLQKAHIESLLYNENAFPLVYEVSKKIIGTLILYYDGQAVKILSIAVHPSSRRLGIGKTLINEAESIARDLKVPRVTLEVSTKNSVAINLYTSFGYRFEGVIENYYAWGDDAYIMSKNFGR
jgi:ribosomal-protein-alanine acetyltransferase